MKVGDTVIAKHSLWNSDGTIMRCRKGEHLKVVQLPPLPGFVVVNSNKFGRFAAMKDEFKLTKRS